MFHNRRRLGAVRVPFVAAAVGGSTNTWNPADTYAPYTTFSSGNLTLTKNTGSFFAGTRAVGSASTGKYYWEVHMDVLVGQIGLGIANAAANLPGYAGNDNNEIGWSVGPAGGGNIFFNNAFKGTVSSAVTGDTCCVAWDGGNKKIWFRTNGGNWNNSGSDNPATNTGGTDISTLNAGPYFAGIVMETLNDAATANFGATAFAQTMPSGFTRWP